MARDEPIVDAAQLTAFAARLFEAEGLSGKHASMAAEALVAADKRGVKTHGVVRIPLYARRLRSGLLNAAPSLRIDRPMPASRVVHADNAVGMVAAHVAIDECMDAAETLGIGAAAVRHANHFGAASVHTIRTARRGMIGIAMSPGSRTLAPHGSAAPLLGTNPFAISAPAGRYAPWSLDMAASVAARGHVRLAARDGRTIPEGWALDAEGRPTTDAAAALKGVMLPFGGAKGSGMSMMVEVMAGVLSGSAATGDVRDWVADFGGTADVGHFFLVMKVEAFMPLAEYGTRMETMITRLKALPPAEGFAEVLYPGERAARVEEEADTKGVPLSAETARDLRAHAAELGIETPF
ncbi:Ldh family oxidoreductase [Alterinioella nitratireducens]|uniref:Ldh family oxidoreductase n=1 Tax=Alterinioella nitratireducens TaxID=2735915 RepID=UPI004059FFC4